MFAIDNNPAPITVDHLAGYGYGSEILNCWRTAGISELLPLQAKAIMETGLLRGSNVLALAPTSAGKTLLGELAAARHFERGRKTIFISPTRALVAEQYHHLQARYQSIGIRVVMATADHTQHDNAIRKGDYDFAVMVYEKLRSFLVSCPDILYPVGAVIADELQILGEQERGETADLLLTRLVRAEPSVQIIGLSAVVDNGEKLARWLNAELLCSNVRPAELREGVYCLEHAVFHYRTSESGTWHDETLLDDKAQTGAALVNESNEAAPGVINLCVSLARKGESCLVFVPTRAMSRGVCKLIASELGFQRGANDSDSWQELRSAEDSLARRHLMECVPAGVGFHNSDLTGELRGMVERAFNEGQLRVLVATPTLAQGVNLKAKNVIQVPVMLRSDLAGTAASQRQAHVPLSVGRYRNQAGRAGRLGSGSDYGRSILVAQGHLEAARLGRSYMQASPEPLTRQFSENCLEHFALDCVHGGVADSYSGIYKALTHTFAWHCGAVKMDPAMEDHLGEAVRSLLDLQLLDETSSHRLRLTGSGQAMAAGGYKSATMRELMSAATDWKTQPPCDMEILCACAFTADGETFSVSATPAEMKTNVWRRAARKIFEAENPVLSHDMKDMLEPAGGLSLAGHSSLKKAVIAYGWISGKPTAELEERFRVVAGTMAGLSAHLAWIATGLAACAGVLQCDDAVLHRIETVADRLPLGLSDTAAGLAKLEVPGASRQYLNRLAAEGFDTIGAVRRAPVEVLSTVVPVWLALRIKEKHRSVGSGITVSLDTITRQASVIDTYIIAEKESVYAAEPSSQSLAADISHESEWDLEIDSSDPGSVLFYGHHTQLSPKPYALISLLARRCGHTVAYEVIDQSVWPDEKVEPQQISAHKSTLVKELGKVAGKEKAGAAIVTVNRHGLRLNLEPTRVRLTGEKGISSSAAV